MSSRASDTAVTIDVHLDGDDLVRALRHDVVAGLTATPKTLPPKWFYDDRGSQLFDDITRLPEYYPTRREADILQREAATIARASGADTLVELGSGTSTKTRLLLDALRDAGHLRRIVPFDVSEGTLRASCAELAAAYPGVAVHGVVGDFCQHLAKLPGGGRRMVALLGGTIGNLVPAERSAFLDDVRATMETGDSLLLGTDLVKDADTLVRAYDDAAGVTAEFNKNVLRVVNHQLGADFDPDRFDHVALWDAGSSWIEMRLRARIAHRVEVPGAGLSVAFAAGEELRTEISTKFRREGVAADLAAAGLDLAHWWTDRRGDFALSLAVAR
jgi:L-histidine N-alpha-methyltransferase